MPCPQTRHAPHSSEDTGRSKPVMPSSLEGAWIEIMKAGDYADRGTWTPEDLDRLAATYEPRLHAAPVVLGHPAHDAPAYGWVRRLRRAGRALWAQLEKVDPALEALLRAGRFRQRSVALYTHFPPTGGPYLRHLGFLGAAPPAVKGLAPVRFAHAPTVSFSFDNAAPLTLLSPADPAAGSSEVPMPDTKSKLESFLDHLRAFFAPQGDTSPSAAPSVPAAGQEAGASAFTDRLTQLEQRLDTLVNNFSAELQRTQAEIRAPEEKLHQTKLVPQPEHIANFVETLRARGRFPPAFERWGVPAFMERLAQLEAQQPAPPPDVRTDPEQEKESLPNLLVWFQEFLTRLPAVIEFRELSSTDSHGLARRSPPGLGGSRLVHFTEPRRGMRVDPASVELAERAEALAAELGISYAQALAQLREEHRTTATSA